MPDRLPVFGRLPVGLMGTVAAFIGFKELMFTVRSVSKDWLLFAHNFLHYAGELHSSARIKVFIDKMYEGAVIVPAIWHPYFAQAEELSIFYECTHKSYSKNIAEIYLNLFFFDLFKVDHYFNQLKRLNLYNTYNPWESKQILNYFQYLFTSEYLAKLEELVIDQKYLTLNNSIFQSIDQK